MNSPDHYERQDARIAVLRELGAGPEDTSALLAHNDNAFTVPDSCLVVPLAEEAFVALWRSYAAEVLEAGTILVLSKYLLQLRFPVRAGISGTQEYQRAVKQGFIERSWEGPDTLQLAEPERCTLEIYNSFAGPVPVITAASHGDFALLVQALGRKNEPDVLPQSMGALMISGYRNWHRQALCESALSEFIGRAGLTDRFILLSRENYSGVTPAQAGQDSATWRSMSWQIRRDHEVTHYFCKRVLGSMRNNIFDELLADYCGLIKAFGRFDANFLLLFLGLESHPVYREGARFQNYRGTPPLDDRQLAFLRTLTHKAIFLLEAFDVGVRLEKGAVDPAAAILALARFCLEELAQDGAQQQVRKAYEDSLAQITNAAPQGGSHEKSLVPDGCAQ